MAVVDAGEGGERFFFGRCLYDGAYAGQLCIEVVHHMEKDGLFGHGQLGRAEFKLTVMAQDHMKELELELLRKSLNG